MFSDERGAEIDKDNGFGEDRQVEARKSEEAVFFLVFSVSFLMPCFLTDIHPGFDIVSVLDICDELRRDCRCSAWVNWVNSFYYNRHASRLRSFERKRKKNSRTKRQPK